MSCRWNFRIDDDLTWVRVKDLYGDVIYAMTSTRAHSNEAIARTVYDAVRAGGWARNKLLDVARQAGVDPEARLRPDITLVANSDRVCGYSGGRIEVRIVGANPSTNVWPELECDFVLNRAAEDPEFVPEASSGPFSADLLVSDPLVSTEWNWKALKTKTERSNQ